MAGGAIGRAECNMRNGAGTAVAVAGICLRGDHSVSATGNVSSNSSATDIGIIESKHSGLLQRNPRLARFMSPEKVLQSFNTRAFKREQPSDPDLMRQIISESMAAGKPVPFLLYWGKGPRSGL